MRALLGLCSGGEGLERCWDVTVETGAAVVLDGWERVRLSRKEKLKCVSSWDFGLRHFEFRGAAC